VITEITGGTERGTEKRRGKGKGRERGIDVEKKKETGVAGAPRHAIADDPGAGMSASQFFLFLHKFYSALIEE
jgi:hypothetical protein